MGLPYSMNIAVINMIIDFNLINTSDSYKNTDKK